MLTSNALTVSREVLEDGKEKVTVDLRRSKVMPERMESPARAHVFYDVGGFTNYVKENVEGSPLVLADVKAGCITAVLDDEAKKGFETITLHPAKFPAFEMLEEMLGAQLPARRFAELLMRNRAILGADEAEGRQLALMMQQLTVASKITACTGTGRKAVNGVMCVTEVKSGAGEDLIELPDSIVARVPLYVNRPEVTFGIDLTVVATRHGEVEIAADAPEVEILKYQELQKMVEEVAEGIETVGLVSVGRVVTRDWQYNR
jgi:hypothetical protein